MIPLARGSEEIVSLYRRDKGSDTHCIHGKSGLCTKSGVQCYQNGPKFQKPNMPLVDFARIMDQISGRTFQVALGGRGDVNKHEEFEGILRCCRSYGVVPNYTTSGLDLTDEEAELTAELCGAVAVSHYCRPKKVLLRKKRK